MRQTPHQKAGIAALMTSSSGREVEHDFVFYVHKGVFLLDIIQSYIGTGDEGLRGEPVETRVNIKSWHRDVPETNIGAVIASKTKLVDIWRNLPPSRRRGLSARFKAAAEEYNYEREKASGFPSLKPEKERARVSEIV